MAGLESASEAAGRSHTTDALAETCQHLEESLEELKVKYEMYFLGVERLEPGKKREELKRDIARLKSAFTRNTGLRFRIQSLHARYLSYERMWARAAREREEGTYRRDLFKARLRRGEAKERPAPAPEDVDIADLTPAPKYAGGPVTPAPAGSSANGAAPAPGDPGKAPGQAPATPAPAKACAPPAAARPGPGLGEEQMRALYDAYVTAKKRCNEDTSRLTYDAVKRSVDKQIPELMTKFQAKAVDFKVVIKGGKALLKAVPRT